MKINKPILIVFLILFTTIKINAQIGIGTTNPLGALDITSTTDGLLIPRVALTTTTSALPLTLPTTSELVYNIANVADVTPGYYYWDGVKWVKLSAAVAGPSWDILGNANIVDGTNFLGTTNGVDVAFKRNNAAAGKIGATSTSFGVGALNAGASTNSTAFGNNALSVSTGSNNVAMGQNALQNCNTTAQWNTAVGTDALKGINSNAAQNNVAIGFGAMSLGTGNISQCVAIGSKALQNSTAQNNTAVGYSALAGAAGSNTGNDNTAVGINSLLQNNTGTTNTAIGSSALNFNQAGNNNVAVGYQSLRSVTASSNTAIGYQAGLATTSGTGNVFIGNLAGSAEAATTSNKLYISNSGTTATNSLIYGDFTSVPKILRTNSQFQIGDPAGTGYIFPTARGSVNQILVSDGVGVLSWANSAASNDWTILGNSNIVDGTNFLGTTNNVDLAFRRNSFPSGRIGTSTTSFGVGAADVVTGIENTAIGVDALGAAGTAKENTAIGYNALLQNTGDANTAVGDYALATQLANAFRTTGVGFSAGRDNTQIEGTFFGFEAGRRNTGPLATLIGHECGTDNQGTTSSTIVGNDAGYYNKGDSSTLIGQNSGRIIEAAGDYNCFVGARTGEAVTTGSKNTFIGTFSGLALATGIENTFLGYGAGATGNFNNTICIGNGVNPTADNDIRIGSGTAGIAFVNAASWSYSSDRRLKTDIKDSELGLNFIKTLRPVSYIRKDDVNKKKEYGFIAQELEKALEKAGSTNSGILSKTENGMFAVRYNDFLPMTIKAVQEQQAVIEELQKTNAELMKTNAAILKRLEKLEKK